MTVWVVFLALGLVVVLLASGVTKVVGPAPTFEGFDVLPGPARRLAGRLLGPSEIVLGLALLVTSGEVLAAVRWLSVVLMSAFVVVVGLTLMRGERPSCECFGSRRARPISPWTLVRNVGLLAAALVVALADTAGPVAVVSRLRSEDRSHLALLVLGTLAFVVLWVRQERLVTATPVPAPGPGVAPDDGPPPVLPEVALAAPGDGGRHRLSSLATRRARLLVFVSPTCDSCHRLVPLVPQWRRVLGEEIDVTVVSIGDRAATEAAFPAQRQEIWSDPEAAHRELGVPGTPSVVLLGRDHVAAGPASGTEEIQQLLGTIVQALEVNLMTGTAHQSDRDAAEEATREDRAGWLPAVGADLAEAVVAREDGSTLPYADALAALADERGGDTLVTLAWRRDCSYCEEILDDVRPANRRGDVVLVIAEPFNGVRAQGLTGPVLRVLPPSNELGAVGVPGTPAAVPVRDGRVAGLGGLGGPHVLEVLAEHATSDRRVPGVGTGPVLRG